MLTNVQGEGIGADEIFAPSSPPDSGSPKESTAFAPPPLSAIRVKQRKRPPKLLGLQTTVPKDAVTRIHQRCSVGSEST